ncbi:molybdenum cofactor sulfurase [Planctomycetota bacterium]|nr:molybdenum cofactor sulfurase [Planctomycetota bacterium]
MVAAIWRYPVKSLGGDSLDACDLSEHGFADDRAWALYGADGKIGSGKNTRRFRTMARLLELGSTRTADGVSVRFPHGPPVLGPGPDLDAALSRWVGEPVTVRPESNIRHHDSKPVHIISTSSLAWLGRALGDDTAADPRRFRANLVVEFGGDAARPEEAWIDRRLAIGGAVLRVVERTARCVMVGTTQRDLPADARLLRALAQENHGCLGVYAEVEAGGTIRCGDTIRVT